MTSDGELLAQRSAKILAEIDALTEDLANRRGTIIGPLRIVAPFGFGRMHVAPCMADFAALHSEITLNLNLTEDPRGAMRSDKWDVLVHVGRLPDLNVSRRKLANNRRILCAAPSYLAHYGIPAAPQDLNVFRCGVVQENQSDVTLWPFKGPNGEQDSVRVQPAFASNDGEVIRAWALDGLGVIERSEWGVSKDLKNGHLVEVLPEWTLPDADIVALINPRIVRAARIEAFVKHLATSMPTF